MTGRLVAFEGIDGSGKTTVARRVARELEGDHPLHRTREPTDTPLGRRVREAIRRPVDPVAQALLFVADHRQHVQEVRARLGDGVHVLSDRWNDSCYAYQGATLAGRVEEPFDWLADGMGDDRRPDRVVLLDLDADVALERVTDRGDAEAGFERRRLLERVRANYHELADRFGNYEIVDADRPVEEVMEDAVTVVRATLDTPA